MEEGSDFCLCGQLQYSPMIYSRRAVLDSLLRYSTHTQINKDLYDQNVAVPVTAVLAGMVKVFVADVVETGTSPPIKKN